jgi:transmembrane sensor
MVSTPRVETAIGEQRTVTLAEGSRVTLNTDTKLTTDLGASKRRIFLERGEAMFEVAHDKARPFIVDSRFGSVRAVGTKFVVRLDEEQGLAVIVTEGKVIVTRAGSASRTAGARTTLTAGQELASRKDRVRVANLEAEQLKRELAWRQGDIVFEGESLAEAAAEMQRYTSTQISVDPAVADYSIGGYFRTGDIDAFVSTVEDIFPVKSERSAKGIRLTRRS